MKGNEEQDILCWAWRSPQDWFLWIDVEKANMKDATSGQTPWLNNNTDPDAEPSTARLFCNLSGTISQPVNLWCRLRNQWSRLLSWVGLLNSWDLVSIIWQPGAQYVKIKSLHKNKVASLYLVDAVLCPLQKYFSLQKALPSINSIHQDLMWRQHSCVEGKACMSFGTCHTWIWTMVLQLSACVSLQNLLTIAGPIF